MNAAALRLAAQQTHRAADEIAHGGKDLIIHGHAAAGDRFGHAALHLSRLGDILHNEATKLGRSPPKVVRAEGRPTVRLEIARTTAQAVLQWFDLMTDDGDAPGILPPPIHDLARILKLELARPAQTVEEDILREAEENTPPPPPDLMAPLHDAFEGAKETLGAFLDEKVSAWERENAPRLPGPDIRRCADHRTARMMLPDPVYRTLLGGGQLRRGAGGTGYLLAHVEVWQCLRGDPPGDLETDGLALIVNFGDVPKWGHAFYVRLTGASVPTPPPPPPAPERDE